MALRWIAHRSRMAAAVSLSIMLMTAPAPASAGRSGRPPQRTVTVRVLAHSLLRKNEAWKVDIFLAVRDVSRKLEDASGITLRIKAYDYWAPAPELASANQNGPPRTTVRALISMNRYLLEAGRAGADLVIGLVPEGPDGTFMPGIADYLAGTVIVKYLKSRGGIPYVLLHEILHVFGAIDLNSPGYVMSRTDPSFRVDAFTMAIVTVNRERSFLAGGFPLSAGRMSEAAGLYERRRALDLGERELDICLDKIHEARSGQSPSAR